MNISATQEQQTDFGMVFTKTVLYGTWNFGSEGKPVTLWSVQDKVSGLDTNKWPTKLHARQHMLSLRRLWRKESPENEAAYKAWRKTLG